MYTDALDFDVLSSYRGRALRAGTYGERPADYLVTQPLPLTLATAANPTPTTLWCDWTGMALQRRWRARRRHARRARRRRLARRRDRR